MLYKSIWLLMYSPCIKLCCIYSYYFLLVNKETFITEKLESPRNNHEPSGLLCSAGKGTNYPVYLPRALGYLQRQKESGRKKEIWGFKPYIFYYHSQFHSLLQNINHKICRSIHPNYIIVDRSDNIKYDRKIIKI